MGKFLVLFGIFLIIAVSHQEMFTAIVDLERLLDTEKKIVQSLEEYLKAEESRLERLTQMKNNYVKIHSLANTDVHSYLANPVNAFLLVKRLTTDWKNVETLMVHGPTEIGQNILSNLSSAHDSFPSVEDLNGAAAALLRLQDTYKLDTSSLARGEIPLREPNESSTMSIELTAGDCFELGKHSYNNNDHYHTVLWMQEALDRVFAEDAKTADVSDILEYLAFSTYSEGNIRHALKLTNDLLELLPNHERALGNKVYYDDMIKKQTESKLRGDEGNKVPIDETVIEKLKTSPREETERETYEALCRGEKRISARTESTLFCFYHEVKSPFMKLMRIKVEEAFKKPHILVFYDVMSNSEIDVVKTLASPKLKRATVQNYKTGDLETAQYRISKSAWLRNEEHEIVNRISQRVEDIIDLEVDTAEELQVVNYGIGGHYEPHYDFARREEKNAFKSLGTGNRIATWLNYMTDVEAGGATVFPMLGVTIWPKKGSAAFWYNLHRSGEGDLLTRHAACPVLVGSKWVSNKWFHESGQEFRRPCGLKVNE
ncbi:Prolyl 4-hydroxylase subunit alpha-2 [Halotydeus destructor]|nr:Prolyl 4-hydroxylase subunit alpha-2 [Halotydeus destructor]